MREYLLCLFAAAAVTYLTTPVVERIAVRFKLMAEVRDRDVHAESTPRLGGLAMFLGLLTGLLLASKLPRMGSVFGQADTPFALLSAATVIVLLGIVDDKWGLDAPIKLAGQVPVHCREHALKKMADRVMAEIAGHQADAQALVRIGPV